MNFSNLCYTQFMKKVPEFEMQFEYTRSRGPGGQNVNKTNSAVILRWYPMYSSVLSPIEKDRVSRKWQDRLTTDGEIMIRADEFREQERNKKSAIQRLHKLLEDALKVPKRRIATKPSYSQKQKRLKSKKHRSEIKKTRGEKHED
jgi:ribosome-associated protein